jgi:hypothetical protein
MRRLVEPMRLDGYTILPDTIVAPCVYLMHRRSDIYPRPLEFEPERFLHEAAGTYTWIPFGGGVRRCVAASFAQLEMKRVIQTVLSELELLPADPRSEGAARSSVSFAPNGGARVIATRRTLARTAYDASSGSFSLRRASAADRARGRSAFVCDLRLGSRLGRVLRRFRAKHDEQRQRSQPHADDQPNHSIPFPIVRVRRTAAGIRAA